MTHLLVAALLAANPTVEQVLSAYDAMMGPPTFKATASMTAKRDDGSTRTYKMTFVKGTDDRSRISFQEPAAVVGQEILRNGENSWIYIPNMKRSMRLASRDSFQGGDFNNADVLRTNYLKDYDGTLKEDLAKPDQWLLELKAKTKEAAYDFIKLWVKRTPLGEPVRGEYYTSSGKMLRSAEFKDSKDFGNGLVRPSRTVMRNELATSRQSEMVFESLDVKHQAPDTLFVLSNLGR